jgi:BCD family chlorophyll transporter-like MFS transporter
MISAPLGVPAFFLVGNFMIGFGAALFGHGTLTATMSRAPKDQAGLALGAWGAVQATAAGVAMALSGTIRDLVNLTASATNGLWGLPGVANGYMTVYALEIALLLITVAASIPLLRRSTPQSNAWGRDSGLSGEMAGQSPEPRGGGAS